MFRINNNFGIFKTSVISVSNYVSYSPNGPIVKVHRKPRWIPIAKSKRFRIPERPIIPEDEAKELLRLNNNYKNHIKSIVRFLTNKYSTMNQVSLDPAEILKHFKEDFIKCSEINDKWNEEVKAIREKRLAEQLEKDIEFAKNRIEEKLLLEEQIKQAAEEIVKREKEASVDFITPENIEAAIDKALAETTDYNFAIDINGEKIFGRETSPIQENEKISLKQ